MGLVPTYLLEGLLDRDAQRPGHPRDAAEGSPVQSPSPPPVDGVDRHARPSGQLVLGHAALAAKFLDPALHHFVYLPF